VIEEKESRYMKSRLEIGFVAIAIAFLAFTQITAAPHDADAASDVAMAATAPVADSHGNLHVPEDYRALYQYLGSWAVANDKGPGSKQLHIVYSSPGTMAAYRKTGHFPDGSVLVKEVFNAETGHYTTGTASQVVRWSPRLPACGRTPDDLVCDCLIDETI
jgi:hypothetical protein